MSSPRTPVRPKQFFAKENLDGRLLGAIRFVNDVDGTPLAADLEIGTAPLPAGQAPNPNEAAPVRVLRSRFGLHVLTAGRGFADYINQFDPPPANPPLSDRIARLRATDNLGRYLPTQFELALPRSLRPGDAQNPTVFSPLEVRLLPSPNAPIADGWSVLRVLVWRLVAAPAPGNPQATRPVPVRGALIRILRDEPGPGPHPVLGRGLTDWRARADGSRPGSAEALVAAPGIPVTTWNPNANGAVLSAVQPVRIEARFHPDFDSDDPRLLPNIDGTANPAGLIVRTMPQPIELRARQRRTLHLTFDINNALSESQPVQT